jgi:hypothetical protein
VACRKSQCAISLLGQIVHPQPSEKSTFTMFKTYLDESGIEGSAKICVVAGYSNTSGKWKLFEKLWSKRIGKAHIPEFKAHDFWARDDAKHRVGHYRNWTDAESNAFINDLINIINVHTPKMVGSAIVVPDFFSFSFDERRHLTGGMFDRVTHKWLTTGAPMTPFHVPMQNTVIQSAKLAKAEHETAYFVCDEQDQYYPLVHERFLQIKQRHPQLPFGTMVPESSIKICALQAADLVCYAAKIFYERKLKYGRDKLDYIFSRLLATYSGFIYFDRDKLAKLISGE